MGWFRKIFPKKVEYEWTEQKIARTILRLMDIKTAWTGSGGFQTSWEHQHSEEKTEMLRGKTCRVDLSEWRGYKYYLQTNNFWFALDKLEDSYTLFINSNVPVGKENYMSTQNFFQFYTSNPKGFTLDSSPGFGGTWHTPEVMDEVFEELTEVVPLYEKFLSGKLEEKNARIQEERQKVLDKKNLVIRRIKESHGH